MRVEPAGEAGQHRGIDKHHQFGCGGVHPKGFRGAGAADQGMGADPQRRNARKPVMGAEPVHISEQIEERDPPGDGTERKIVTRQPHRDRTDQEGSDHRHRQRGRQRKPRRPAEMHRERAGGIGAEADKSGLPERSHAADAGQKNQTDRDQAGNADIVEQRDPVIRHQPGERHDQDRKRTDDRNKRLLIKLHSVSSAWGARSERHASTGMIRVKTSTSLKLLAQNENSASAKPTASAATTVSG